MGRRTCCWICKGPRILISHGMFLLCLLRFSSPTLCCAFFEGEAKKSVRQDSSAFLSVFASSSRCEGPHVFCLRDPMRKVGDELSTNICGGIPSNGSRSFFVVDWTCVDLGRNTGCQGIMSPHFISLLFFLSPEHCDGLVILPSALTFKVI